MVRKCFPRLDQELLQLNLKKVVVDSVPVNFQHPFPFLVELTLVFSWVLRKKLDPRFERRVFTLFRFLPDKQVPFHELVFLVLDQHEVLYPSEHSLNDGLLAFVHLGKEKLLCLVVHLI